MWELGEGGEVLAQQARENVGVIDRLGLRLTWLKKDLQYRVVRRLWHQKGRHTIVFFKGVLYQMDHFVLRTDLWDHVYGLPGVWQRTCAEVTWLGVRASIVRAGYCARRQTSQPQPLSVAFGFVFHEYDVVSLIIDGRSCSHFFWSSQALA